MNFKTLLFRLVLVEYIFLEFILEKNIVSF